MSVSFLCHNVTASAILRYCSKLEKMALRATCRWLAAFIEKQKVEPHELLNILYQDESVPVFEASIHPDSTYWYDQPYHARRGEFIDSVYQTVIMFDCVLGYQFVLKRFLPRKIFENWYHSEDYHWFDVDLKLAIDSGALNILKYLTYSILHSIEKRIDIFWRLVHYGSLDLLRWFIQKNILPLEYIKNCPVAFNVIPDVSIDRFIKNIRFLRYICNMSVFEFLMMYYTATRWKPELVIIIATEIDYVPSSVCKKLSRITQDGYRHTITKFERDQLHQKILPICGGHKPVRKRNKK